jgi:hypothetical protein
MARLIGTPNLRQIWRTAGTVVIRNWRGNLYATAWPRKRGRPKNQIVRDNNKAWAIMQRWSTNEMTSHINAAQTLAKGRGGYPRDIFIQAYSGKLLQLDAPSALSAAVPDYPLRPLLERINRIIKLWTVTCGVTWQVWAETFFPAATSTLIKSMIPSIRDIQKNRAGISYYCGLKQLVQDYDQIPGEGDDAGYRWMYEWAAPIDKGLWYFWLTELASEGLLQWVTLAHQYSGACEPDEFDGPCAASEPIGNIDAGSSGLVPYFSTDSNVPGWLQSPPNSAVVPGGGIYTVGGRLMVRCLPLPPTTDFSIYITVQTGNPPGIIAGTSTVATLSSGDTTTLTIFGTIDLSEYPYNTSIFVGVHTSGSGAVSMESGNFTLGGAGRWPIESVPVLVSDPPR